VLTPVLTLAPAPISCLVGYTCRSFLGVIFAEWFLRGVEPATQGTRLSFGKTLLWKSFRIERSVESDV
jgi:hypothetical protein